MNDRSQPLGDPLISGSLSEWFATSFATVRRSLVPLVVIQLVVFVPVAVIVGLLGGLGAFGEAEPLAPSFGFDYVLATESATVRLLSAVLGTLGLAASVFVIVRDAAGRAWTAGDALGFAGRRFLPMIGWIVLSVVLTAIGYVLLILPGIYLTVVFGGTLIGVLTIERGGLGRTFQLVNPRFFGTLGRLLLLAVLSFLYSVVAMLVAASPGLFFSSGEGLSTVVALLTNLLTIPLIVFTTAALVVLYGELRADLEPGTTTGTFAEEIDRR
ncbi:MULTISPECIES: hypothetical protein [Pseudonocardia]|uniref:Glycerophosphoryl diester phosphodiesterase membrane domain-containing protein n=2 Tax=Pseudonocardia TaxID=1847 RepID=A0A1Y2N2N6_PSEAH|nr:MULTISPECIES: hypothetical protein [Pseudonocardia]OSY41712.1 hypothetical protein BG845_01740 [Pseudonocardia autotrophica]TDN71236.1 hypothetical protein C8E95_0263 [Pseudonocardia autotrophica]BBG01907.1 hypothetical protein Pdca_31160 [Pseudonocardia autotrophica]GEC23072.1 hypothetical protein PSA01_01010 [Pseudonocardia saturnea]